MTVKGGFAMAFCSNISSPNVHSVSVNVTFGAVWGHLFDFAQQLPR
jgi:hypothetical protein